MRQAVVLAGGLGTRLGELTKSTPKPALDVGGRPFLLWLLDELRRYGVTQTLVLAGFQAGLIRNIVSGCDDVTVLVEPEPLGTGGALRLAADRLETTFYFLNGDSLFDVNLLALSAEIGDGLGALSLRPVADGSRFGEVGLDGDRITAFRERPERPGPTVINGGVACLRRGILDWIPGTGAVSIERDVYPRLAENGLLRGRVFDRPFIDIGIPDDFVRAQTYVPEILRRGAVIFDRDGVLNHDVAYAHRPDQITWVKGAKEAVRAVNDAGMFAFVATNQAGVARGFYGEADVQALHRWMNEELAKVGAHIDAFEYSPYHPDGVVPEYSRASECRKPGPGMLNRLLARSDVIREKSIMIGDKPTDMEAANSAGILGVHFDGVDLLPTVSERLSRL
jgi:D-glycero-D-manno-heptose 1,7-bisphosphate phosphatase